MSHNVLPAHGLARPRRVPLLLVLAVLAIAVLAIAAGHVEGATIRSWTGGGANNNWMTAANWGGTAPEAGDYLVFPSNDSVDLTSLNNTNNFPAGTPFGSITFLLESTNYVLRGSRVVFSTAGTAISSQSSGQNTVEFDVQLTANVAIEATLAGGPLVVDGDINLNGHNLTNYAANSSGNINIGGRISGTGDLLKTGDGTLLLDGGVANTYVGTTRVVDGVLLLNDVGAPANAMVPGDVVISSGAVLRLGESDQIADTANVTVMGMISMRLPPTVVNGVLDLNSFWETIGSLTLSGGGDVEMGFRVDDNFGRLTINGNVTASASSYGLLANPANIGGVWAGELSLGSATRTLDVANNSLANPDLIVQANVIGSGGAGITKTGSGQMRLNGISTYPGLTTVSDGWIYASNPRAFGNATAGTVLNGGSVLLEGVTVANEWLTNNSTSSILEGAASGSSGWSSNIVLNADLDVDVLTGGTLNLSGAISGTGGITKSQPGTLVFSGSTANTLSGAVTVNEGVLELNKSGSVGAVTAGSLIIGDGVGGNRADVVKEMMAGNQIYSAVSITINGSGLLDLNGFNDTIGTSLTMNGNAAIETRAAGTLTLGAYATVTATPTDASIGGNLNVGISSSGTCTFDVSTNWFSLNAIVSGAANIVKSGGGRLFFSAANTFSGSVTANDGILGVTDSQGLGAIGSAASGTIVNNPAKLQIWDAANVGNEYLTLNTASPNVAMFNSSQNNSWAGPITLNGSQMIEVASGSELNLSGAIGGVGSLTKVGAGTLRLSGATANTYGGATYVDAGTLVLDHDSGGGEGQSVPPGLFQISGVVRLEGNNQIADTADVTIQTGGVLQMNGHYDGIDELSGNGSLNLGANYLNIGRNNGSSTFSGVISGTGFLQKYGTGTITLAGINTYTGMTYVRPATPPGTLLINGSQPGSSVQVDNGAILGGTGTIGNLTANGAVSPGASPGKLTCGNVTFGSAGSLAIELNGNTVGSGYDQLNVVGTANLTGAALAPLTVAGSLPKEGDQFIIVNNDASDAVTGPFDSLSEGAVVASGNFRFRVSYAGGSGNDVVLTMVNQSLTAGTAVVLSGNGNGAIEPNECNLLSLGLNNVSAATMNVLTATLQSLTPGVVVSQPYSTYPSIPASSSRTSDSLFQISTQPGFACGTTVNLELEVVTTTHGTLKVPIPLASVCTPGSGICELCPDVTLNSALGTTSTQQTGRLNRNHTVSVCGSQKTYPLAWDSTVRSYDAFTFRNGPSDACITVTLLSPTADVFSAAYTNSFNPASIGANYRADAGYSTQEAPVGPKSYGLTVAANQVFVVTVNEVNSGTGGEYSLSVRGGDCRPALNVTRANPSNVKLDWTTAAPGYHLEGANLLNGVLWDIIPPNPPTVVGGKFTVTDPIDTSKFFYRLHKP